MSKEIYISIIIPVFNSENYIKSALENLKKQNIEDNSEIIIVDDGSTDRSLEYIKNFNIKNLHVYELKSNYGPAKARNYGIQKAMGDYIYFFDADDSISNSSLSKLLEKTKNKKLDIIFSDRKRIENLRNRSHNIYAYDKNKYFDEIEINKAILNRLNDPLYLTGLLDLTGRLIKRSIIVENNVLFRESLRYMEDEVFMWDLLPYINSAYYIKEQLYSYNINPNVNTGVSESLMKGFPLKNFKLVKEIIQQCLNKRNFSTDLTVKLGDQSYIFFIISSLISFCRSIELGKLSKAEANKKFLDYIKEINNNDDISKSLKNYTVSSNESRLIPIALKLKSNFLLKIAVKMRVSLF